jgi:hypothetical protein
MLRPDDRRLFEAAFTGQTNRHLEERNLARINSVNAPLPAASALRPHSPGDGATGEKFGAPSLESD